jgi:predicted HAD superfamily Cof-like phosphohydrolase
MNLWRRVYGFMLAYGQHIPAPFVPTVPSDAVIRQRCKWQLEETLELLEACFGDQVAIEAGGAELMGFIKWATVKFDMVKYADANGDIRYVAYGNDIAAGIDSRAIDAEISRSNDTKTPPAEPGGKVQKGPNYEPPMIAAILREQGWKGYR